MYFLVILINLMYKCCRLIDCNKFFINIFLFFFIFEIYKSERNFVWYLYPKQGFFYMEPLELDLEDHILQATYVKSNVY